MFKYILILLSILAGFAGWVMLAVASVQSNQNLFNGGVVLVLLCIWLNAEWKKN